MSSDFVGPEFLAALVALLTVLLAVLNDPLVTASGTVDRLGYDMGKLSHQFSCPLIRAG